MTINYATAQTVKINKIEMMGIPDGAGKAHWIAKLHTVSNGIIVADNRDINKGGEVYTPYHEATHKGYSSLDVATKEAKLYPKATPSAELTLAELIRCVSDGGISKSAAKCFLYTYRMILFAAGTCDCLKCLSGTGHGNKPFLELDERVHEDVKNPKIYIKDAWKNKLPDWAVLEMDC